MALGVDPMKVYNGQAYSRIQCFLMGNCLSVNTHIYVSKNIVSKYK